MSGSSLRRHVSRCDIVIRLWFLHGLCQIGPHRPWYLGQQPPLPLPMSHCFPLFAGSVWLPLFIMTSQRCQASASTAAKELVCLDTYMHRGQNPCVPSLTEAGVSLLWALWDRPDPSARGTCLLGGALDSPQRDSCGGGTASFPGLSDHPFPFLLPLTLL